MRVDKPMILELLTHMILGVGIITILLLLAAIQYYTFKMITWAFGFLWKRSNWITSAQQVIGHLEDKCEEAGIDPWPTKEGIIDNQRDTIMEGMKDA